MGDKTTTEAKAAPKRWGLTVENFVACLPTHEYLLLPTGDFWPASSVDGYLPKVDGMRPSEWLDRHRPIMQVVRAPGLPRFIKDRLFVGGGWVEHGGVVCLNLAWPPRKPRGTGKRAKFEVIAGGRGVRDDGA
jgi:hypothetical protein